MNTPASKCPERERKIVGERLKKREEGRRCDAGPSRDISKR